MKDSVTNLSAAQSLQGGVTPIRSQL